MYPLGATYNERAVVVRESSVVRTERIYHQDSKTEFRLCTDLYFQGYEEGSILEVIRQPDAGVDFEYRVHSPDSPDYDNLQGFATDWVGSGNKRWGYSAK
jgi:hypothetical protein